MKSFLVLAALVAALGASQAFAGAWQWNGRQWVWNPQATAAKAAPQAQAPVTRAPAAQAPVTRAPVAQAPMAQRRYSYAPAPAPWPYYPNYGYWAGSAYSRAAAMREGQVYGTFGLRPANARAAGNY